MERNQNLDTNWCVLMNPANSNVVQETDHTACQLIESFGCVCGGCLKTSSCGERKMSWREPNSSPSMRTSSTVQLTCQAQEDRVWYGEGDRVRYREGDEVFGVLQ